jgi:hypothetical protein
MNRKPGNKPFFNWLSILLGLVIAVLLLGGFWAAILVFRQPAAAAQAPNPEITVVVAPTLTPVISLPTSAVTPTATNPPPQSGIPTASGSISVGMYVQISSTGGSGLRLHAEPGTSSKALFLGMESEVYLVQDGPQQKDGFTWYYLVAPYDKSRSGWAASNYLVVIQKPNP